jgi:hypothetical protein
VLSSTSNSDSRRPQVAGWFSWVLTAMLFVALVSTGETYWRNQGHRPSVVDDNDLWCVERSKVSDDVKCVVLLGASRMLQGFDTELFAKRYPDWTISQLAIWGASPLSTLEHLSQNETFRGTILCSIMMDYEECGDIEEQREWIEYWNHQRTLNKTINRRLSSLIQSNFSLVRPNLSINNVLTKLADGEAIEPYYLFTAADRSRGGDYTMIPVQDRINRRIVAAKNKVDRTNPTDQHALWVTQTKPIRKWVQRINKRGGKVIFIRFPIAPSLYQFAQKLTPRSQYFDRFGDTVEAHTIHFKDIPAIANIDCPDSSHIDQRDKEPLTAALLDELVQRNILPAPKPQQR